MTSSKSTGAQIVGQRIDSGSFVAGLLFTALGIAFALEATGRWTFELSHFRFVGPLVLILIGLTTIVGASMARRTSST